MANAVEKWGSLTVGHGTVRKTPRRLKLRYDERQR